MHERESDEDEGGEQQRKANRPEVDDRDKKQCDHRSENHERVHDEQALTVGVRTAVPHEQYAADERNDEREEHAHCRDRTHRVERCRLGEFKRKDVDTETLQQAIQCRNRAANHESREQSVKRLDGPNVVDDDEVQDCQRQHREEAGHFLPEVAGNAHIPALGHPGACPVGHHIKNDERVHERPAILETAVGEHLAEPGKAGNCGACKQEVLLARLKDLRGPRKEKHRHARRKDEQGPPNDRVGDLRGPGRAGGGARGRHIVHITERKSLRFPLLSEYRPQL